KPELELLRTLCDALVQQAEATVGAWEQDKPAVLAARDPGDPSSARLDSLCRNLGLRVGPLVTDATAMPLDSERAHQALVSELPGLHDDLRTATALLASVAATAGAATTSALAQLDETVIDLLTACRARIPRPTHVRIIAASVPAGYDDIDAARSISC